MQASKQASRPATLLDLFCKSYRQCSCCCRCCSCSYCCFCCRAVSSESKHQHKPTIGLIDENFRPENSRLLERVAFALAREEARLWRFSRSSLSLVCLMRLFEFVTIDQRKTERPVVSQIVGLVGVAAPQESAIEANKRQTATNQADDDGGEHCVSWPALLSLSPTICKHGRTLLFLSYTFVYQSQRQKDRPELAASMKKKKTLTRTTTRTAATQKRTNKDKTLDIGHWTICFCVR